MTIPLYLLHGWAVNGAIFHHLQRKLPEHWDIHTPHLLGHGDNHQPFNLIAATDAIAKQLSQPSIILGWSLGGLVALHIAARYPQRVKGLILSNTFARFTPAPDYPEGVSPTTLQRMAQLLHSNYPKYLRQFLELQLLHTPERNHILTETLPPLLQYGIPTALHTALTELEKTDARPLLTHIHCPTLLLYGGKDAITPPRMGEYLAHSLADAEYQLADKAAHTPFLSHTDWCVQHITKWVTQYF